MMYAKIWSLLNSNNSWNAITLAAKLLIIDWKHWVFKENMIARKKLAFLGMAFGRTGVIDTMGGDLL